MNITLISDSIYTQNGSCTNTIAKAFADTNCNVNVILPFYEKLYADTDLTSKLSGSFTIKLQPCNFSINVYSTTVKNITYYFVSNYRLFGREKRWGYEDDAVRTAVFCMAAIELLNIYNIPCEYILSNSPNTALIPILLKFKYYIFSKLRNIKSYHYINSTNHAIFDNNTATSVFGLSPEEKHFLICNNKVNLTKGSIVTASRIFIGENAIKMLYERNDDLHRTAIQFGFKIHKFRLGIDYNIFSPDNDTDIHKNYTIDSLNRKKENKLFVQKYLYLAENSDTPLFVLYPDNNKDTYTKQLNELARNDVQIIIISNNIICSNLNTDTGRLICIHDRSAETLKNIFSASDFCLFGGFSSECSNPAFISAAYGCIPIVPSHRFFDIGFSYFNKLALEGNGYTYNQNIKNDLSYTLRDAINVYTHDKQTYGKLVENTMKKIFSAADSIETIKKVAEKTVNSFI